MQKVFNIFYALFIALLVLVGAFFLLSKTPLDLGIESKIVQSGSMEPAIPVGALVVIHPQEGYKAGDVITFGEDSGAAIPTTHRVLSVNTENGSTVYMTKGDANEDPDPGAVPAKEVIGKVVLSVPYAGFILDFARQPLGFALLIGFPALLVIISELASIAHELLNRKRPSAIRFRRKIVLPRYNENGYVRRFLMDDVFLPRTRCMSFAHYAGALSSATAVVFISVILSFNGAGGTLSYFRDMETSLGNIFSAASSFPEIESIASPGETEELIVESFESIDDTEEEQVDEEAVEEEVIEETPEVETVETVEGDVRGARDDRGDRGRGGAPARGNAREEEPEITNTVQSEAQPAPPYMEAYPETQQIQEIQEEALIASPETSPETSSEVSAETSEMPSYMEAVSESPQALEEER